MNSYISHHGIKGMHWGIRRYQPYNTIKTPNNTTKIDDYKGPLYFVSESDTLKSLSPRVPSNYLTENGYEDAITKRVCFAPSVDKCLAGLSQNLDQKTFTVYEPIRSKNFTVYKPNRVAVPDCQITDEMWVLNPVKLKKVKTIKITGNRGTDGKKYKYGNNEATLYDDWIYKDTEIYHHGIPGHKVNNYISHHGIHGTLIGDINESTVKKGKKYLRGLI